LYSPKRRRRKMCNERAVCPAHANGRRPRRKRNRTVESRFARPWKEANDPSLDSLNTLDDIEARELRNDYSAASVMDYVDLKADEADEADEAEPL